MKLEAISIKGFRCYKEERTIKFGNLTTLIGRNDIGKSSILEALEIFFNNDVVKIEQGDLNIHNENDALVSITCEFSELPPSIDLDAGAETTLSNEYLLTRAGTLKIKKTYNCATKKIGVDVFILAHHPTAEGVSNLLDLKEKELQAIVKAKKLDVALKGNASMRRAIWAAEANLGLKDVEIAVMKEDGKRIWEQLEKHLPLFALFQSDRSSTDSDEEVQNPMKAAIAAALAEVQVQINDIQRMVQQKAEEIARKTHEALVTIDPGVARNLNPQFTPPTTSKWTGLFSLGMDTDDGIPLNKRGSGVRRLVLVSFFKAEAERKLGGEAKRGIIYAIEEPETAQHPNNQAILIDSFKALASSPDCSVILTTHSPGFASDLPTESIRFITRDENGCPTVKSGVDVFDEVADALGVVPDNRVKVLLCVEGPSDVTALKCLSRALHHEDASILDLSTSDEVAFVPLGGSTLKQWVANHYLKPLRRPEVHIYDQDKPEYAAVVAEVNGRPDRSWARLTRKYEIENYLHKDAINLAFGVEIDVLDHLDDEGQSVAKVFALAHHARHGRGMPMNEDTAKKKLAAFAFPRMTAQMIRERDPDGEVEDWLRGIAAIMA